VQNLSQRRGEGPGRQEECCLNKDSEKWEKDPEGYLAKTKGFDGAPERWTCARPRPKIGNGERRKNRRRAARSPCPRGDAKKGGGDGWGGSRTTWRSGDPARKKFSDALLKRDSNHKRKASIKRARVYPRLGHARQKKRRRRARSTISCLEEKKKPRIVLRQPKSESSWALSETKMKQRAQVSGTGSPNLQKGAGWVKRHRVQKKGAKDVPDGARLAFGITGKVKGRVP